jgi:hypothetical protein
MVEMSNGISGAETGTDSLWGIAVNAGPVGIKVSIPYRPGLLAEILRAEIVDPLTLLLHKALHTADFVGTPATVPNRERTPTHVTLNQLRQGLLKERKMPRRPQLMTVSGMFSTAVLLNSGWWERARPGAKPVGRNEVQRWTYAGFEEWGPSWDFTSMTDNDEFFLGQLGEGDEANSVLVAAVGARARRIRAGIVDEVQHGGTGAIAVDVTGLLCHRSHLTARNPELSGLASRWHADFNYCLLLDSDHHRITPVREVPDFYSAYLWQCWCATDQLPAGRLPTLNDCYMVWEHTDLTKPDAIKYNLDSLAHKYEYLRREYGNLVLLQKSGPLVPGTPRLPSDDFQGLLGTIGKMAQ